MIRLLVCILLLAGPSGATELQVGTWTGSYLFSGDEPLQVKLLVKKKLSEQEPPLTNWNITMTVAGVAIDFSKIQLTENQLDFRMDPGEEVDCSLRLGEGGIYTGECRSIATPNAEQVIKLFIRPPVVEKSETESAED